VTSPAGTPTDPPTVADAVGAAASADDDGRSLARGSLRFVRTLALSVGIQGPTAGVIIGPAIIAGIVGPPGALAQVLALVAMGFVAYAFVVFSRSFNTAGSVYAFNGSALGPGYGFVSAWLLLLVYLSFAAGVYASSADIAQSFFASIGVHGWWVWFALVGAVAAVALAYLSIGWSNLVIFVCEGASIVLIAVVGVAVLVKGGYHHHAITASAFRPHGVSVGLLALGVVAAFGQFSGFEGATTLGDEAADGTRTIPAAVAGSLILSAAVYIFFTWIVYNAYPSASAVAADPAPLVHVADSYVSSWVGKAVNLAGTVSAFGAQLACISAAARLLFALGRELGGGREADNFLVRTSRGNRAPVGALAVVGVVSLAALGAFSFEHTATRAATLIIEYGAYLILAAYLLTVFAALVWVCRRDPRPLPIVVLGVGVVVLGYVGYRTFSPFPAAPFDWVVAAASGSALVGVAILAVPGVRARLHASPLLRATVGREASGP
jgi:amino acid transporter